MDTGMGTSGQGWGQRDRDGDTEMDTGMGTLEHRDGYSGAGMGTEGWGWGH